MKAEIITPAELDSTLVEKWRTFQSKTEALESPFFAPEFTSAVGQVRPDARIAVISVDGEVRAFLPYHLCYGNVAKPIGGQINDYQGLIHTPDFTASGSDIMRACRLSAYDFNHAPTTQSDLIKGAYQFWASPQITLAGGYEAYASDRPPSFRSVLSEIRRRTRKIEAEFGPLRFEFQDASLQAYDAHVDLRNKLYERDNVKSLLGCGSWIDKTLDVLRQTDTPGLAGLFSTLYVGDHLIAAHFGMRSRNVWHWWFPSYDIAYYKFGPGKILINQAAQTAVQHGLTKIDFGRGNSTYKLEFSNTQVELAEGSIEATLSLPGIARHVQRLSANSISKLPLGRYRDLCRRAGNRILTGGVRV